MISCCKRWRENVNRHRAHVVVGITYQSARRIWRVLGRNGDFARAVADVPLPESPAPRTPAIAHHWV